jgi:hypothetical protein
MSHNFSPTMNIMTLVVLFAGAAGIAHADDSSLGRFSDDIDAYLQPHRPSVSNPAPAFRKTHPNGLSEREYQELSSEGAVWHRAPVSDTTPSTFRQSHPNGLFDREYQALSSNSSMWQSTSPPSAASARSTNTISKAVAR